MCWSSATMDDPQPSVGEVRIRIAFSGVNPGDVKKREDAFGVGMPYPRVIPHSDGSGTVDAVGEGVSLEWIGRRVWCYGAQSYRPFGTAAEYTVVPLKQVVPLPEGLPMEQGACLGIPGITAHRAVHVAVRLRDEQFWCKAVRGRSELVPFSLRIRREPESSPPAVPRATRESHREQEQTRSC
jgi:NADPH:quinone reductase-like Zn-dependent oxidoreductase